MRSHVTISILLGCCLLLTGCQAAITTPYPEPSLNTPVQTLAVNLPSPTQTTTPSPTPTPTKQLVPITATVWQSLPQVPVLMYHRFDPQPGAGSYNFTTSLTDFDGHLAALDAAGYSLVPLEAWLRGEMHVPENRRPLILTIDDLYYADQISLDENGQPAFYSAIGRLWQFSQSHPDFGFHAALFYNLGDKAYANDYTNGVFSVLDGWRQDRAEAIAWGVEHGAMPMNHFYNHPFLNTLNPAEIEWELVENDRGLREALAMVEREDLAAKLPNILALPYVVWPDTDAGKQVLYDYLSPEGAPVAAIVEADYASNARLLPAPFTPEFERWHIPRINATWEAIQVVIQMAEQVQPAQVCALGEFSINPHLDPHKLANAILSESNEGTCPDGIYVVGEWAFQLQDHSLIQLSP